MSLGPPTNRKPDEGKPAEQWHPHPEDKRFEAGPGNRLRTRLPLPPVIPPWPFPTGGKP